MAKDPHKIIVLTGGIATGKTTVKKKLIKILNNAKIPYYEISGLNDLYLPFAIKHKIIKKREKYSRQETTKLVKKIYKKYGREFSTKLLIQHLQNKPNNVIYLIDSKRNPDGIIALRKNFPNTLVIATHSDLNERIKRYKKRNRKFDKHNGIEQNPLKIFLREEKIFNISKSVSIADLIIENHEKLPHEIEVKIFTKLVEKGFMGKFKDKTKIEFPNAPSTKTNKHYLDKKTIASHLDQFLAKNKDKNIIVIQGGNRYILEYLTRNSKQTISELKLLDIGKVKLRNILQTMLTTKERTATLDEKQQKEIIMAIPFVSKNSKRKTIKKIKNIGFKTISQYLKYASTGEVINLFADYVIETPFTYPADDRKIARQFAKIPQSTTKTLKKISELPVLRILMQKSKIYLRLSNKNKKIAYIDDVFYRGRTFYALKIVNAIMNIKNKWTLYTLCADRVSNKLYPIEIEVLRRNKLYPFENSIGTEKGYWEQTENYFTFRDMQEYAEYLNLMSKKGKEVKTIKNDWEKIIKQVSKIINQSGLSNKFVQALIELYIEHKIRNKKIRTSAIIDQRAQNTGYSTAFIKVMHLWINQGKPRWKRQQFKNKVTITIENLEKLSKRSRFIDSAINQYKEENATIDNLFCQKLR